MAMAADVIDVTDATFAQDVLDESKRRPVVVDFWADWCQPCRMIGPVLERLAGEHQGQFRLAKLDVDANPQAAAYFRIQSIPAVKAFKDGALVNEFLGAIPERSIRDWLGTVLPTEADRLVDRAGQAEVAGRVEEARKLYLQALEEDPKDVEAGLGLGRLAALDGDAEEAERYLNPLRPNPEAERILAALEVAGWAEPGTNGQGPLAEAARAAGEGRWQEALDVFLAAVTNGSPEDRDAARERMVKVFSVLGDDDPLVREYRRKLSAALF
jgi:putative thioredoxin